MTFVKLTMSHLSKATTTLFASFAKATTILFAKLIDLQKLKPVHIATLRAILFEKLIMICFAKYNSLRRQLLPLVPDPRP